MLLPTGGFSVRGVLAKPAQKKTAGVGHDTLASVGFFWVRRCIQVGWRGQKAISATRCSVCIHQTNPVNFGNGFAMIAALEAVS